MYRHTNWFALKEIEHQKASTKELSTTIHGETSLYLSVCLALVNFLHPRNLQQIHFRNECKLNQVDESDFSDDDDKCLKSP